MFEVRDSYSDKKVYEKGENFQSNYCVYNYYTNNDKEGKVNKRYPIRLIYFGKQATMQSKYSFYKLHKSFLRKNRKRIITGKFIRMIGRNKIIEILSNAKTI